MAADLFLSGEPGPRRSRKRDLARRSRQHTGAGLRRERPEVYTAIVEALRAGVPAAEIAREVQASRRTIAAVRRLELNERDVAQLRESQARRAREVAALAADELIRRLVDSPSRVPARELVGALRVANEVARADEGPARRGEDGAASDEDAREVILMVRRGSRRLDGFGGEGRGAAGAAGKTIEVEVGPAPGGPGGADREGLAKSEDGAQHIDGVLTDGAEGVEGAQVTRREGAV